MRNMISLPAALMTALALSSPATADPSVAVSRSGADNAGCGSVAAPCRMLQYAFNRVDAGGKIDILDSAEYGPLTISKAISVDYAGKGVALVTPSAPGRNAVSINASATDVVRLRGLTVDGGGTGLQGIYFLSGARLEIENCAVRNFTGSTINLIASASSFLILNTAVSNSAQYGVRAAPASGGMKGDVDGLQLYGNTLGGFLVSPSGGGNLEVVVVNSVATGNRGATSAGFRANGAGARLTLRETTIMDNTTGVSATSGGLIRLSRMILSGNGVAAVKSGGVIETFGDNIIRINVNDALGALTPTALH